MILPFSTQMNGKPTYFIEKIWCGVLGLNLSGKAEYNDLLKEYYAKFRENIDQNYLEKPKLHTIRLDKNDRWKAANKIDFFINCRQKDMFRFAPRIPVVSVQDIFMTYAYNDLIQISVNGRELFGSNERLELAINDGFDTWEDFFNYFYPIIQKSEDKCFSGKLIHWTDLRY